MNDELFFKGDELSDKGDFVEAFEVFMQGAKNGDTSCMTRLALMYTCGEGVACDYDKAIEWELEAIRKGDIPALVNVGISYRNKGNIRKSKYWFEKALAAGDSSGALELAKLYMVSEKETDRVVEYLKVVVEDDNMCEAEIEEAQKLLLEV